MVNIPVRRTWKNNDFFANLTKIGKENFAMPESWRANSYQLFPEDDLEIISGLDDKRRTFKFKVKSEILDQYLKEFENDQDDETA